MLRRTIAVLVGFATTIALVILGHYIFDRVTVPDLCDHHNQVVETSWLFDLFFPVSAVNGYHPGPGLVFYGTTLLGGMAATALFRRLTRHG